MPKAAIALILSLSLSLFLMPAPLSAQGSGGLGGYLSAAPGQNDLDGNRLPSKTDLPDLTAQKLTHKENSQVCPANFITYSFFYPQGTGNEDIDREMENLSRDYLDRSLAEIRNNGFCDRESCGGLSCAAWEDNQTFAVYQPSAAYLSILLTENSFTGGAHGNTAYTVMNFNKTTGARLRLTDLFPNPDSSLPLYWDYVYAKWCERNSYKFPLHYGSLQPCGQADAPDNPNTYRGAGSLDDLGRLVFNPQGLSLVLGPYESGSHASGTITLDLPKDELIKMGADPAIWND